MRATPGEDDPEAAGQFEDGPGELERNLGQIIAERVREYRRQSGWTVGHLAELTGLSKGMLSKVENAQASPSLTTLVRLSEALSVPITAFFRGLDEEHDLLYIPAGTGLEIMHKGAMRGRAYQLLGRMRSPHDRFEPVLVTLTERTAVFPLYQHAGTELLYMLEGEMEYGYGAARYTLKPGDALQFVGEVTHGPVALIDLPVRFLAIKSTVTDG
ncbi:helix-turn-helix domain-containing protein [Streptomyces aureus]|uniref:Helix-turn-helix domain-containing protein n=1 Tax=Streptomyces aureus TaxID=193461 RepID=A0ABV4SMV2_9ACTN